jgi:hypothetical protein
MGALVRKLEVNDMLAFYDGERQAGNAMPTHLALDVLVDGLWVAFPRLLESSLNKHELTKEQSATWL